MADLSPDLSIYQHPAQQLDIGSLLALQQRARQLQTQQAESDAYRASGGDPNAAAKTMMRPGAPGFVDSAMVAGFANAAAAKAHLQEVYNDQLDKGIVGLYDKGNKATDRDWHDFAARATLFGVPPEQLTLAGQKIVKADGSLDRTALADFHNQLTGGAKVPMTTVKGAGYEAEIPAGGQLYGNQPGTAAPPPPAAKSTPAQEATQQVDRQYGGYGAGGGVNVAPSQAVQDRWHASAAQYSMESAADYQSETVPIQKTIELLAKHDAHFTGAGTTEFNNVKNLLHTLHFIPDDKMDSVVDFQSMQKYMDNFANARSMGGTDARLWQAIAGSPSPDKLQKTNLNLARVMYGLRNMQQAALNEFSRAGRPPEYYADWRNAWAQKQDPMAYAWDTMSAEEQEKYAKAHFGGAGGRKEYERFVRSYESAKGVGQ